MNKNAIWIGVVIILVIGIGAYLVMNNKPSDNEIGETNGIDEVDNQNPSAGTMMSMKELLAAGQSKKCEFNDDTDGRVTAGTMYISGGMMRGDFNTTDNNQAVAMHMIVKDQTTYTWIDGQNSMGFKMMLNTSATTNTNTNRSNVDLDKKIDYRCSAWAADNSMFEMPSGVQFNDLNAVIPQATPPTRTTTNVNTSDDANKSQCAACDSLPSDSRDQCRSALGC